ncbi:MAG: hypothetical protein NVS2B14_07580 [Chamaesiphon sp.]
MTAMQTPSPSRRMVANLKPGDRIRVSSQELPLLHARTGLVEVKVLGIERQPEGWHTLVTDYGKLKPRQPTDKYELV